MLPKNKSFTSLNNLNGIGPLSGLPLNQLTNSLSSLHNLASMQQFGQQLNSLTLSNLNHLNDGPGLSSLNSNLILENLGLLGRSSDEREGCRSLICDNNGVIIGETTYRCMICNKINESIAETRQHYYEVHAGNLLGNANSPHSTLNSLADVANAGIGNSNHNSMAAAAAAAAAAIISNSNSHNDHHHSINNSSHNTGGHGTSNGHSIHNQSNNQNHNIANNNGASSRSQTPNHLNYVANHPMKISAFNQVNGAGSNNLKKDNNNNSSSLSANLNPLSPHSSLQALSVAQLSNSLQGALSNNSNGDLLSLAGGASLLQPRKMKMEQHQQQHNSSQQSTQLHSSNSAKKRKIGDVVNKILNRNLNVTGNASSLLTSSNGTMYNGRSNSLEVGSSIRSPTDDRTVDAVDDLVDDPVDDLDEEPEMEYDHWSQMLSNAGQLNALTKVKGLSESALLNTFGRGLGAQPPFDNQLDLVDNFSNGLLDQLFQAKSADSIMKEESPRSIPSGKQSMAVKL